ncbi:membrane protein [Vibrio sp. JCM 19236]|nr:membrane protein [Vibrio sp. JCM 19236]
MLPQLSELFRWQANLVDQNQWWRIVTGSFTHTNLYHLGMNLAGYWLLAYLFHARYKRYAVETLILATAIGIGLLFTSTQNYYGLSGALHGLFAIYATREVMSVKRSSWLLLIGLGLKIAAENSGMMPISSASLIGARISTESHLIGSLVGLAIPFIQRSIRRLG